MVLVMSILEGLSMQESVSVQTHTGFSVVGSPTPAKLLEQRSAERKSLDRLPAFLEEGAEGSSSRSSSSSLNTSDEDERLARMRPKRGHQRAPHGEASEAAP